MFMREAPVPFSDKFFCNFVFCVVSNLEKSCRNFYKKSQYLSTKIHPLFTFCPHLFMVIFVFFNDIFLIEVWLLYNAVSFRCRAQSFSYINIYIERESRIPCAIR